MIVKRYERIGIDPKVLHNLWNGCKESLTPDTNDPVDPIAPPDKSLSRAAFKAVILHFLGFVADDRPSPMELTPAGLAPARDYFFSGWEKQSEFEGLARGQLGWFDPHPYSLALALALGDHKLADDLLGWPDHDVFFDEGAWDATRQDVAVYIEFCRCMSGRVRDMGGVSKSVSAARQKRAPAFLHATEAILAKDPKALGVALGTLVEWHIAKFKREWKVGFGYPILSLEASILWMVAGNRGIDLSKTGMNAKWMDYFLSEPCR